MITSDKILCVIYAIISLVALPATWINNLAFMNQPENSSMLDFFRAAYANSAAASLSNDLLLLATAACIFMAIEGRRVGVRFVWLYLVFSALIAISVTFPLFLIARQIAIAKTRSSEEAISTVSGAEI